MRLLLASIIILGFWSNSHATQLAASCSRSDVNTAVQAATYGETVTIPACSPTTWTTTITVTKGVTIEGAGVGVTTIVAGMTQGHNTFILIYDPDATSRSQDTPFKVSGITFDMNSRNTGGIWLQNDGLTLPITKVRIYNNEFKNLNTSVSEGGSEDTACIRTGTSVEGGINAGDVWGVVHSNTFTDCGIVAEHYGAESNSWNSTAFDFGSTKAMYWEDNTLTGNSVFHYGGLGGRYVSRFNNYTFTSGIFQVFWDMHGNQSGDVCATMGAEIYRNTLASSGSATGLDHRGGKLMVFDNVATGNSHGWQIRDEADESECPESNPQPQYVSDSYYGLNTRNGSSITPTIGPQNVQPLVENTQYWLYQTVFTGTVGTGRGTVLARPITCTTGVGYWTTDEGSWNTLGASGLFYKCTSPNTWTLYYTPLTYPHPLRVVHTGAINGGVSMTGGVRLQ